MEKTAETAIYQQKSIIFATAFEDKRNNYETKHNVSEAMHNAFETKCPMSESTYRTMEMKDIAQILRLAVWRSHAVTVVAAVVSMLAAIAPATHAKDISPMEAVRIARRVVNLSDDCAAKARAQSRTATPIPPYYIYNDARGQGFVIVAGDDEMGEILAYSRETTLDTLTANPCVKLLLEGYRQTYEAIKEGRVTISPRTRNALYTKTVEPLLKSKWGQSHPFNAKTGYPYSGCVATAVAQMMYYYQWPAQGKGSNEYLVKYYNTMASADFSQSHYDWANMLPDYRYPIAATQKQEDAVALLMSDVGIASFMQYTPDASGTQGLFAYKALQKHFDYTAAYVTKAIEGPSRFAEILRQELLNGCPVYLDGRPAGTASGHAWVADGFDQNGLFHMNFGWEGQGDAYYSLTNLNVTETGSEFQGKPLAFNRALTAILAHPNNGKYPDIDRGLLETSPQLMFNEGGSLSIKGADKTFNPSQTQTVEVSSFVNRGNPFRGDIGVAVYDAQGKFVRVAYSDDHATGGLTQRIYGDGLDGYMGTDYLINEPQPIRLSLAQLADGYYRLIAVCTARKDDGSWDDFFPIKKAPIIEVELSSGSARISEICSEEARFQLMGQPRLSDEAYQGEKVVAFFPVKNLNGVPRDCYLRVRLLDADRTVVLDTRVDALTEIEGFTETEIPITLSIPASLVPARYEVQLEMTGDEAETLHYPILNIHDRDAAYIDVVKRQDRPIMAKAEIFLADDSNSKVESGSIDITRMPLFKLGVSLRATEGRSYEGYVYMFGEDTQTHEIIQIPGIEDNVSVHSSFDVPLFSYWLRQSNQPFADGHTYRIYVTGKTDGNDVELTSPKAPAYYLKREGSIFSIYSGTATAIDDAPTTAPTVSLSAGQLAVSAEGLRAIRLYSVSGTMVGQAPATDARRAELSLQSLAQGVYLLRIEAGARTTTYRFMHRTAAPLR